MAIEVFKALANEIRYNVVRYLLEKEHCISDFISIFNRDFSVLYRHIKVLEEANIIEIRKKGKVSIICLKNPKLIKKLLELAEEIKGGKDENNECLD